MGSFPSFSRRQVEVLAKLLGEGGSGSDTSPVVSDRGLIDASGESTKWRRLYSNLLELQRQHRCANHVLDFIRTDRIPARFVSRGEEFGHHRQGLNIIHACSDLEYGKNWQFCQIDAARTLDEAEARARTIRAKFKGRLTHPEVLKYCRVELLHDIYFHAVFEAAKGLAQRIGTTPDYMSLISHLYRKLDDCVPTRGH